MLERGLGALLVYMDANRYYLSGFELHDPQINESSGCLILTADGRDWLCTDPRYAEAALEIWDKDSLFIYSGGKEAAAGINALLRGRSKGVLGFEARCLSLDFYQEVTRGLSTQRADGLVESLRMIKDAEEIERISVSTALNHRLMALVPELLRPGRTEKETAWEVESFYRSRGAEELAFPSIVAVGVNAAKPHAVPGDSRVRENCCVLVDCGCRLHDYCSDQTRVFWVGDKEPDYFRQALDRVREAQRLAIEAVRPGVSCRAVYAAARGYFERLGVAEHFNHGLGHGIGLQTHEAPSLNSKSEVILRPGMVTSIEPGLYYPEWGGVRWEYLALVTEDGCRTL